MSRDAKAPPLISLAAEEQPSDYRAAAQGPSGEAVGLQPCSVTLALGEERIP